MDSVRDPMSALEGVAEPPRKNGELVFEAPWESRAFGMAVALHGEGAYTWEEFSARLAEQIAATGGRSSQGAVLPVMPNAKTEYYERWLEALENLVLAKGLVSQEELAARTAEFSAGLWDHHD